MTLTFLPTIQDELTDNITITNKVNAANPHKSSRKIDFYQFLVQIKLLSQIRLQIFSSSLFILKNYESIIEIFN